MDGNRFHVTEASNNVNFGPGVGNVIDISVSDLSA